MNQYVDPDQPKPTVSTRKEWTREMRSEAIESAYSAAEAEAQSANRDTVRLRRSRPGIVKQTPSSSLIRTVNRQRAEARVGALVDHRYRLEGLVGCGATAAVFRASDERDRREVAVKVLHPQFRGIHAMRERAERAIFVMNSVQHRNINALLGHGVEDNGSPYAVFELLKGSDLSVRLAEGIFELGAALDVTLQTLAALDAVHKAGFIHRDVKPQNLFLTKDVGEKVRVTLIDFGIARGFAEGHDQDTVPGHGVIVGSPLYLSPEQITAEHPLTPATDVWQVGAVLFTMLTRRPPFQDPNLTKLLVKAAREEPPPVRWFRLDCPEPIAEVIDLALSRDPELRFPDAESMSLALSRAAERSGHGARAEES